MSRETTARRIKQTLPSREMYFRLRLLTAPRRARSINPRRSGDFYISERFLFFLARHADGHSSGCSRPFYNATREESGTVRRSYFIYRSSVALGHALNSENKYARTIAHMS